jgi:hypothetical protein
MPPTLLFLCCLDRVVCFWPAGLLSLDYNPPTSASLVTDVQMYISTLPGLTERVLKCHILQNPNEAARYETNDLYIYLLLHSFGLLLILISSWQEGLEYFWLLVSQKDTGTPSLLSELSLFYL